MSKLDYKEFLKKLSDKERENMNFGRLGVVFRALTRMDKESRSWYIRYLMKGIFPKEEVDGTTVEELIRLRQYTPTQAFLVLDWLKHDPQSANRYIMRNYTAVSEKERDYRDALAHQYLQKLGVDPTSVSRQQFPDKLTDEE